MKDDDRAHDRAHEQPLTTSDQDAWVELAQAIRGQLRKAAELLPAMSPDDMNAFLEAARSALWLEQDALSFDQEVEVKRTKAPPF